MDFSYFRQYLFPRTMGSSLHFILSIRALNRVSPSIRFFTIAIRFPTALAPTPIFSPISIELIPDFRFIK